jgi:putative LysE/RhtB family amino acid efflux pump
VLALIAVRTLWSAFRVREGGETVEEIATPGRAYATALVATASNPLTIASWAAIFSAASVAGLSAAPLLLGVAVGSSTWFAILAGLSAAAGRRATPGALRAVDIVAGVGLAAFAGVLGARALRG